MEVRSLEAAKLVWRLRNVGIWVVAQFFLLSECCAAFALGAQFIAARVNDVNCGEKMNCQFFTEKIKALTTTWVGVLSYLELASLLSIVDQA